MKPHLFFSVLSMALMASAVVGCNNDNNNSSPTPSLSQTDRTFLTKASYGNNDEVTFAIVADSVSQSDTIRNFASMMIQDHGAAQQSLDSLTKNWNVNIPPVPDSAHLTMLQQMITMQGRQFDSAYIHGQVTDHQDNIAAFQHEIDSGSNSMVKSYASKYLPVLQMHLKKADSIANNY